MNDIKYSVLMSIYHKENPIFFIESIESMLKQTFLPNEIVIVKDGPLTLELDNIIDKYVQQYDKLFTIVSIEKNIGLGKALDEGIKHCKNELIARMDTDDISLPNRCELQIKKFKENPNLSIVGTWIDEFYDEPNNIISSRIVPIKNEDICKFMRRRSPFNHPTVMYKKSKVVECGGYGKMRRKQDLDLFSRMINGGCIAENINMSLLLFRSNEDNFKRRKSWSYCKSDIDVQFEILKRKHCNLNDFMFVFIGQLMMFFLPMFLLKKISGKYLRKNK